MNTLKIILLLLLLIQAGKFDAIIEKFTKDFYQASNIKQIVTFGCWNETDAIAFIKFLANDRIAVSLNAITPNMNLHTILTVNYYHLGVMLDLDCLLSDLFLEQFSNQLAFNESYVWLMFSSDSSSINYLHKLPLSIDAEVTLAIRSGDEFTLSDIWNPSWRHNGQLREMPKGKWSPVNGLHLILKEYKYSRRKFDLMMLNFSVALNHPAVPDLETYLTIPTNRHFDAIHRSHYAFVLKLKDMFNFTIRFHTAKTWGYQKPDGSFDGVFGQIVNKTIDMSISPFRHRPERIQFADFTVETLRLHSFFLFRHPRGDVSLRNNFLKPFTNDLWRVILMVSIAYWISLLITSGVQRHYDETRILEENFLLPVSDATLTAMAALSQQGVSDDPHIISGRIIFLSLFVWGLLLFQFYSASIVGSLLTIPPRTITQVKNLTDSNLACGAEDIPWAPDMFRSSHVPEEKDLFEKKIKPLENTPKHPYFSMAVGMKKVQQGGFAFYTEATAAYNLIERTFDEDELCDLQEIQSHAPRQVMMITSKKSPFTKMMIYGLQKVKEVGLAAYIHKVWFSQRSQCPDTHSSKPVAVKFEQFAPAIFLLLIGISLSIFIFAIECLCHFWNLRVAEQPPNS